ncbi:YeeE/YedE family protein [uncultured Agrobacterium sp.]|uniref:YeeE/YedE family protein n=1 Tax=uncultured Agrobacterium sp. TaxID=157277 RepID=UPI0025E1FC21|nr:YeeE/YedE family protein [uncultured Agrobacterium sp.]
MRNPALERVALALAAGALFGFGLSLSGMIDPARVSGFLDVASGHWDPSLMFVLAGAVMVAVPGVLISRHLAKPILAEDFGVPAKSRIDRPLLIGSAMFGIGWGLAGFCPGPALSAFGLGLTPVAFFVTAMIAGMLVHDRLYATRS